MDNKLNNNVIENNIGPVTSMPRTMKFDPMTGEPIVHEESNTPIAPVEPVAPVTEGVTSEPVQTINIEPLSQDTNNANDAVQIQNELQSIPTVEQGKEAFINNVQSMIEVKKEEKKEGVNFLFIIILFVVILAAIFFLFPLLLDYI